MKLFFLLFFILFFVLCYHAYKFRNPYKLIMVFGKKGSGKTTMIAKLAFKYAKKGRPVYSTVPVPGCYLFDASSVGISGFPPESVIFIDEVGMIWDSRDFKSFKGSTRDYFKLQRHYHHTIYLFSQAFDIDKKLRDLTDQMYLVRNYFNCVSVARRIIKRITIVHASGESGGESRLADDMDFDSLFFFWCGAIQLTYIPRWARLFDSFDAPPLNPVTCEYIPFPEYLTYSWHKRARLRMIDALSYLRHGAYCAYWRIKGKLRLPPWRLRGLPRNPDVIEMDIDSIEEVDLFSESPDDSL